jgi:DNA-binding CsgD family transcriptional regulator
MINIDPAAVQRITATGRIVWREVANGKTTKEIAADRGVSYSAIDKQRDDLHRRLGTRNAADLTRAAIRFGLIEVEVLK